MIDNSSPVRTIASPKLIRGLSLTKKSVKENKLNSQSHSPDIRIKSSKYQQNIVRKMGSNNSFEQTFHQSFAQNSLTSQDMNVNITNQNQHFNKTITGNNRFLTNNNQDHICSIYKIHN